MSTIPNLLSLPRHHRASSGAVFAFALAAIVLTAPFARGATYTWINTGSDFYTKTANWDLAAVPGSADTANIANNGTALYTDTMTNLLQKMLLGGSDASGGNFTMSGGVLAIT